MHLYQCQTKGFITAIINPYAGNSKIAKINNARSSSVCTNLVNTTYYCNKHIGTFKFTSTTSYKSIIELLTANQSYQHSRAFALNNHDEYNNLNVVWCCCFAELLTKNVFVPSWEGGCSAADCNMSGNGTGFGGFHFVHLTDQQQQQKKNTNSRYE